ncbi:MAG: hypothetical protein ACKO7R_13365 [Pseudanabaena sp.]
MNTIKSEIVQRLEIIPDDKLREVLSFLNYLVWQTENSRTQEDTDWLESDLSGLDSYEPYEWQEGELQEGLPVKFVAETGKIEINV